MRKTKKIPSIIHLVFLNKNEPYPQIFQKCIARIKRLHPKWEIRFYNQDDAEKIISNEMPFFKPIYDNYHHTVQKADVLRVILVYLFGGFYLDMDMLCIKPLDDLRRFTLVLSEEKTLTKSVCKKLGLKERLRVANYMFGSVPKHPFWLKYLQSAAMLSTIAIKTENDILESTGPGLLSNLFSKLKYIFPEIVLLNNHDRQCLTSGHRQIACHFGNYAAHLHRGTWRWGGIALTQTTGKENHHLKQKQSQNVVESINALLGNVKNPKYKLHFVLPSNDPSQSIFSLIKKIRGIETKSSLKLSYGDNSPGGKKSADQKILFCDSIVPSDKLITTMNQDYIGCIVTSGHLKNEFTSLGLNIPIFAINPGFVRLKRNFSEESDCKSFNIGYTLNLFTKEQLDLTLAACKELLAKEIPNICLKIYVSNSFTCNFEHTNFKKKSIDIHKGSGTFKDRSEWYNDIHCNLYLASKPSYPLVPYESLYLGIPTLTTKNFADEMQLNERYLNMVDLKTNQKSAPANRDQVDVLKASIIAIHDNYEKQKKTAFKGAIWTEDKWSLESAQQELLEVVNFFTQK
ncbi:glycosyltransferase family 32 protein [Mucilaginibacter sp. UYCu711]|uniref:glycosyltransferase family 32 protein n=1 Tax=Mucilaginibacter sp. UYCu711 TaxID=3156339 RepID=UPI003D22AD4D